MIKRYTNLLLLLLLLLLYVTSCDLEKCVSFNKTAEITGHVRYSIHV